MDTFVSDENGLVLEAVIRSAALNVRDGAHLRNMAFYNFGVRMLERVHARKFMPFETAVHRLTGELADWFGTTIHAGQFLKAESRLALTP